MQTELRLTQRDRASVAILTDPIVLLRIEGAVMLVLAVTLYWKLSGPWWLFLVLILAPDLFMVGYLWGPRVGAAIYNLGHLGLLPGILVIGGIFGGPVLAIDIALIWFGHIGGDRLLGYGFKLPTAFQDTHLGGMGPKSLTGSLAVHS